jgi:hypothetical protein
MGAPPTATAGDQNRITATLVNHGPQPHFQLDYRGEAVPLLDSAALNRWAAAGIVDRHKIALSQDGVSLDGRTFSYADPQAAAELERVLNRPHSPSQGRAPAAAPGRSKTPAAVAEDPYAAALADSLRVTRDGFEFHVLFRTRFGENKTEKLEKALELFQNMRAFKPHVSLQKSGIRLVVTRWDGDNFIEEPGIENVEHASPEELEALIKANMPGGTDAPATVAFHAAAHRRKIASRVEVLKRPQEARFHLLLHLPDGRVEEGPVLIRSNMAKLLADGLFRPDVSVSMTAMNDRITVVQQQVQQGKEVQTTDTIALVTLEDAKRVEEVLNICLRAADEPDLPVASSSATPILEPLVEATPQLPPVPLEPLAQDPPEPLAPQGPGNDIEPRATPANEPEASKEPAPAKAPPPAPQPPSWLQEVLAEASALPIERLNQEIFEAVRARFERVALLNEHDCPSFSLDTSLGKDGEPAPLDMVLTPHYLLCALPFGYIRFGPETRLFLNRLDDYISFPEDALRAVICSRGRCSIAFVVSKDFAAFLKSHPERSYSAQFSELLPSLNEHFSEEDLIWPRSREDRLFDLLVPALQAYGLPVSADSIVLDTKASVFVGFKKAPPHGIEFRDGDDYVRFTPTAVELVEDGVAQTFSASEILRGWALDPDCRVCALYREKSEFVPPAETKLLRFLNEQQAMAERDRLNTLAEVSEVVGSPPAREQE